MGKNISDKQLGWIITSVFAFYVVVYLYGFNAYGSGSIILDRSRISRLGAGGLISATTLPADRADQPWHLSILFVGSLFLGLECQCELDQPPNCFRARGLVMLLLGPTFNVRPQLQGVTGAKLARCL